MTSPYDTDAVSAFYDRYGIRERDRLSASANARIIAHLHEHFLFEVLKAGDRVLDVGCGAGYFARKCLERGALIELADVSRVQLELAVEACDPWKERLLGAHHLDALELSSLDAGAYDLVLCYGSSLCYLLDRAGEAASQMVERLRPGGSLVTSVGGRFGVLRFVMGRRERDPADFFERADYWHIHEVLRTGDLPAHPEVEHPPRHFFTDAELRLLLTRAGLQAIETGAAPSVSSGLFDGQAAIEANAPAWANLLRVEEDSYRQLGLVDSGEFLLARGVRAAI